MALETRFTTRTGEVALLDGIAMQVPGRDAIDLVRIVEGRRGKVEMHMQAMFRFDYGGVSHV